MKGTAFYGDLGDIFGATPCRLCGKGKSKHTLLADHQGRVAGAFTGALASAAFPHWYMPRGSSGAES